MSGLVDRQAYIQIISKQKSEIYLNILEEDTDNLTELMPEECTSSRHDEKQLAIKVFNAQFDLMKVTSPITLSLYPITSMDKNNENKHVTTTNGGR